MSDPTDRRWTAETRQRWFYGLLAASLLLIAWIVSPFLDALLFATATVVVTWPIYARVLRVTRGRRRPAALLTATGILLLILVPLSLLGVWFVQESSSFVQTLVDLAQGDGLRVEVARVIAEVRLPVLEARLEELIGQPIDLVEVVAGPLQRGVVTAGQFVASALPNLVGSVASAALDLFVYLFAVVTLYSEGATLLAAADRFSPLRPDYHRRLFEVFREFSTNLVLGSFATATLQATVAGIGYSIVGVPNLVLVTLLTGVGGFVPIVGTALVWVPVAIWAATRESLGWALFVVLWNGGLTGMVDNLVRPFLLRGRSTIHPLPIVLSVLGGLLWLGLPGALVGPVAVAMFLALYRIWVEDFGGGGDAEQTASVPPG